MKKEEQKICANLEFNAPIHFVERQKHGDVLYFEGEYYKDSDFNYDRCVIIMSTEDYKSIIEQYIEEKYKCIQIYKGPFGVGHYELTVTPVLDGTKEGNSQATFPVYSFGDDWEDKSKHGWIQVPMFAMQDCNIQMERG